MCNRRGQTHGPDTASGKRADGRNPGVRKRPGGDVCNRRGQTHGPDTASGKRAFRDGHHRDAVHASGQHQGRVFPLHEGIPRQFKAAVHRAVRSTRRERFHAPVDHRVRIRHTAKPANLAERGVHIPAEQSPAGPVRVFGQVQRGARLLEHFVIEGKAFGQTAVGCIAGHVHGKGNLDFRIHARIQRQVRCRHFALVPAGAVQGIHIPAHEVKGSGRLRIRQRQVLRIGDLLLGKQGQPFHSLRNVGIRDGIIWSAFECSKRRNEAQRVHRERILPSHDIPDAVGSGKVIDEGVIVVGIDGQIRGDRGIRELTAVFQIQVLQVRPRAQIARVQRVERGRERHAPELFMPEIDGIDAVSKGIRINRVDPFTHGERGQLGPFADIQRADIKIRHAASDGQVSESRAAKNHTAAKGCDRVRNHKAGQRRAVSERLLFDGGDTVSEVHA